MLTFIFNVLCEVLGIGVYIVAISFSQKLTMHVQHQGTWNWFLNMVLANFERPLSLLHVEQTPTALVADGQRQLLDSTQQVIDFTLQCVYMRGTEVFPVGVAAP